MRWKPKDAPGAAMSDDEARAWLFRAAVRLFPTTADRSADGSWTAALPEHRAMLAARRDVVELREAMLAGDPPLPLVSRAIDLLDERGLLEKATRR